MACGATSTDDKVSLARNPRRGRRLGQPQGQPGSRKHIWDPNSWAGIWEGSRTTGALAWSLQIGPGHAAGTRRHECHRQRIGETSRLRWGSLGRQGRAVVGEQPGRNQAAVPGEPGAAAGLEGPCPAPRRPPACSAQPEDRERGRAGARWEVPSRRKSKLKCTEIVPTIHFVTEVIMCRKTYGELKDRINIVSNPLPLAISFCMK